MQLYLAAAVVQQLLLPTFPNLKPIENDKLIAKWNVTFEIDSENAMVGCTLERWNVPKSEFQLLKT